MKAIVGERGQVTIPKSLREQLGITAKTMLEFREEDGRLIVEKLPEDDPVGQAIGCMKLERRTDDVVRELRGG